MKRKNFINRRVRRLQNLITSKKELIEIYKARKYIFKKERMALIKKCKTEIRKAKKKIEAIS
jgi:hypothetical protein